MAVMRSCRRDEPRIEAKIQPQRSTRSYGARCGADASALSTAHTQDSRRVVRIGAMSRRRTRRNRELLRRAHPRAGELARLQGSKRVAGVPVEDFITRLERTVRSYLVKDRCGGPDHAKGRFKDGGTLSCGIYGI